MEILGYFLAFFIGSTLGLIGSGGSIIAVPVFVYIFHIAPATATAYSLFTVGITALVGTVQKSKQRLIVLDKVLLFGIPTVSSVFITRKFILPYIPDVITIGSIFNLKKAVVIMLFFALFMIFAAIKMIRPTKDNKQLEQTNYFKIVFIGLLIGFIAGFVGAGGGFLIVPSLIFLTKISMKKAVGTSLVIIAFQSLLGFLGDITNNCIMDWQLLLTFTSIAIIGIFIGNFASKKVDGGKLKSSFGYFILLVAIFIIIMEVFIP